MPTAKPRVQVTLEPQTHEVIERLAALQGRTRGSIIAELLDSIAPTLGRTVALLEAAADAPKQVKQGLRSVVHDLHQELVAVSGDAAAQLDMVLDRMDEIEVNPHVVTRGSGIPTDTSKQSRKTPAKPSKPRGPANG